MKTVALLFTFLFLLNAEHIFAHGDHSHNPISAAEATSIATKVAKDLASRDAGLGFGKLPESWASVPIDSTTIHKKGMGYYIVSVTNKNENKTLYVLMSNTGEVYDANFSGSFSGVE